jgi:uncharacterized protein YjiS (DUF1127 family)
MTSLATPSDPASAGSSTGISAAAKAAWAKWRKRAATRRTIAELSALDDRTLVDIGIHRSEILSVGWGIGFDRIRRPRHG